MKKIIVLIIILVAGGIGFGIWSASQPGELDGFAQCLKDKKVIFYGAFWCPHCQNQKKLFGRSASLLPYVECSTANGQGMSPICQDNKVTGYPTWVFPDETRESGEVPLATLAEKSGCVLPPQFNDNLNLTPTTTLPNIMTVPTTTSPQP
jgi:thiol-disulfide isomerase/thioredoxin